MKKTLLLYLLLFIAFKAGYCQRVQILNKAGSTEILLDEKVDGFGPVGNISFAIASNDQLDSITFKAYPNLKNLPDSLTGLRVFTYIGNKGQFYFQNYRKGVYSRKLFLTQLKNQSDTTMLTNKMVKCYFSFAIGYDRNKIPKYVIDANGNNDFSDDQLFTLEKRPSTLNIPEGMAKNVAIEYYNGKEVKQEQIMCLLSLNLSSVLNEIDVSVSLPQYRYARVSYEGENFYVCSSSYEFENSVYIIPERPYFKALSNDYAIKPHQISTFGNTYFKFEPISQNLDRIKFISGYSNSDQKVFNVKPAVKTTPRPLVSEQVGMLAPEIKGINVQDGLVLSLNALRGKYVFLDFWATWCGPCIMEFPYIRKVYDTFSSDQFVIIGVTEDDYNKKIKKFLNDKQVTWPIIVKSASTTKTKGYSIQSWPTSFLIAPDGKIIITNLRNDALFNVLERLKIKKK